LFILCSPRTSLAAEGDLEVRVEGSQLDRRATRDTSAASTVLRRGDLQGPGTTAATSLTHVPGVQVQQTGSSSDLATASIRGTTSAQTPVYLAGIRLNDDISGTADLSTVPVWMLDRIEVYRGNAPTNAELLGIGGAVFFEPRYPRGDQARAGLGFGSWGQSTGHLAIGTGSNKVQSLLALRRESARNDYGYLDNAGTAFKTGDDRWVARPNADQSTTDWWTVSRLELGHSGQVTFLANAFDREQGIPGLLSIAARRARAHVQRELIGISGRSELRCGATRPCQILSAVSYQRASTAIDDPASELGLGASSVQSDARRVAQLAQFSWPFAHGWTLTPQGTLSVETLSVTSPGVTTLDAKRMESGIGSSIQWQLAPELSLVSVARLNLEATRAAGTDTVHRLPVGRVGAAYRVARGLSLLANIGYYNRVPTLGELHGTSALVVGNPGLKPEYGLNRDIGARYAFGSRPLALSAEVFAFQQDLSELVAWQRSSFGQIRPYNVGRARLRGVESQIGIELFSVFRLETAATLLDPRDTTPERTYPNDILPFRSRLTVDTRVELHTAGPSTALRVRAASVSLRAAHRGSRYQDAPGLIIVAHSTTFDLQSRVQLNDVPVILGASVYNLFDQPRFDLVGYPLPPRAIALEAALEWERMP
jgi:iron complex outermembrane receptor protein